MDYPQQDARPDEWIAWYRWKIGDMDRLLQGAYRECGALVEVSKLADDNRRLRADNESLRAALSNFSDRSNWSDRAGCLQWIGKRHAIEFAQSVLDGEKG